MFLKAYKNARSTVIDLVGKDSAKIIFKAISKGIPIIICEDNAEKMIDGELYQALKSLGAKKVYSKNLLMHTDKKIVGTFCAVFNEYAVKRHSQCFENTTNAGDV